MIVCLDTQAAIRAFLLRVAQAKMSTDEYVYIIPRYYVDERCFLFLFDIHIVFSSFSFAIPWLDFAAENPDAAENALARHAFQSAMVVLRGIA